VTVIIRSCSPSSFSSASRMRYLLLLYATLSPASSFLFFCRKNNVSSFFPCPFAMFVFGAISSFFLFHLVKEVSVRGLSPFPPGFPHSMKILTRRSSPFLPPPPFPRHRNISGLFSLKRGDVIGLPFLLPVAEGHEPNPPLPPPFFLPFPSSAGSYGKSACPRRERKTPFLFLFSKTRDQKSTSLSPFFPDQF